MTKLYEYAGRYRPVDHFTIPKGYVGLRRDDAHRFGVAQYERPLSKADIEAFELDPLDPADPINVAKRYAERHNEVMMLLAEHRSVVGTKRGSNARALLTFSTRPGVDYQVTHFDGDTPWGHIDCTDFGEAVRAMSGYELSAPQGSESAAKTTTSPHS